MREIEYGWCTHCNAYRHSGKSGFFSRSATGHCKHCGTKLREGRVVVAKDRFYSDTTADTMIILSEALSDKLTSFYDIPDHSHTTDEVRRYGGDFGGAGASSSWDSGSSDSGSSSSDSGSSGGGD